MDGNSEDRILILGAGGMLGSTVFRFFSDDKMFVSFGTLRTASKSQNFDHAQQRQLLCGIDVTDDSALESAFSQVRPAIVINCIGIIKQHDDAKDPLASLTINSLLPHKLAGLCERFDARLIHMSTDCVFSGKDGDYVETDFPDANDLYGRTKFLGEVNYPHAITLRTSIIGHEIDSSLSLVDWFLAQEGSVEGFTHAIFSGMPTITVANVIKDYVLANPNLAGVYHLSASPISKYELLLLIANIYQKDIEIIPNARVNINRSLNSERFRNATGFAPRPWPELITDMHRFRF